MCRTDGNEVTIEVKQRNLTKTFSYDAVYGPSASQRDIYQVNILPMDFHAVLCSLHVQFPSSLPCPSGPRIAPFASLSSLIRLIIFLGHRPSHR